MVNLIDKTNRVGTDLENKKTDTVANSEKTKKLEEKCATFHRTVTDMQQKEENYDKQITLLTAELNEVATASRHEEQQLEQLKKEFSKEHADL
jgi:NTP pyrophosphatase (non-canonical NTP hydrolase)